ARILEAAERAFARQGFHQTTMPDIASEAGMSAANLYRYFDSKVAIIAAFAEQERTAIRDELDSLAEAPDLVDGLVALAGRYLSEEKEELAVSLEIAAEACRNAAIAKLLEGIERDVRSRLGDLIEAAKATGQVDSSVNTQATITLMMALSDGLGWRRVVDPGFRRGPTLEALQSLLHTQLKPNRA
ncbi:MAG: TetR/AcrR family transcriptional regulator, partial [Alphaproteobacteria bacterium]|nr:TetR/AcrR family transcriptional regulator [Alphaproteobacteria bacterium]